MSTNDPTGTIRTRPYTMPEVFRAIAHAVTRPGHDLVQPETVRICQSIHANQPAAELTLEDGKLASITNWANVMDPVGTVTVIGAAGESVYVMVTGRLVGPTVSVVNWVDDLPLEVRVFGGKQITLPELVALADGSAELSVPALVGAR